MSSEEQRPSLIQRGLWETRRAHYIAVFERALLLLLKKNELPSGERGLVRELHFATVTARRELDPQGLYERPVFETQNLPDSDSDEIEAFEEKRPDIQWFHDDESALDDHHREKAFVVECKRLGATTPSGWNLNEQYVTGGVHRFRSPDWRYGNHMSDGMMIGFVQDMEPFTIHEIVNEHLADASLSPLRLQGVFVADGISHLDQSFERMFPQSPFCLMHRWLDIRSVPKKMALQRNTGRTKHAKKAGIKRR